jgi:hypothetical protein
MSAVSDIRPFLKAFQTFFCELERSYRTATEPSSLEKTIAVFKRFKPQILEIHNYIESLPETEGYCQLIKATWRTFSRELAEMGDSHSKVSNAVKQIYSLGLLVEAYAVTKNLSINPGIGRLPLMTSVEFCGILPPLPTPAPVVPAVVAMPAAVPAQVLTSASVGDPYDAQLQEALRLSMPATPALPAEVLASVGDPYDAQLQQALLLSMRGPAVSPLALPPSVARVTAYGATGSRSGTSAGPASSSALAAEALFDMQTQEAIRRSAEEAKEN